MTEAEFREAFHRNKDVLFRFAYRMTGSEATAEDVVQDCFTALWRKPDAYEPGRGALRAFLLGIARNRVLKQWRDDGPQEELEDDSAICDAIDLAEAERGEMVSAAIANFRRCNARWWCWLNTRKCLYSKSQTLPAPSWRR
jgi:RNA polymerase sigma factor (sigma-70 family)